MDGLTKSQQKAWQLLQSGANVFLTGGAGVGKSFLLNKFIAAHAGKCLVTAPSGIAAQKVGGVTVHSAFSVKLKILDDTDFDAANYLLTDDERKELNDKDKMNILLTADVLIIDEISMLRSDVFSFVMKIIKTIGAGRKKEPPVIKEKNIWRSLYSENISGYAFKTLEWQNLQFQVAILTEVVRQKNPDFSNALNKIRLGDTSGLEYINEHAAKKIQAGPVICGRNKDVAAENQKRFAQLKGKIVKFDIEYAGEREEKSNLCCEEHLELKVGAKVLFLMNDIKEHNYKNGSYGIVQGFSKNAEGDDIVNVEIDGQIIDVERATWDVQRYKVVTQKDEKTKKEIKKVMLEKVGEYKQFPLRLGWSLTAHKAQGQDYDTLNIKPDFWAAGQLYVALSRARSVEHLYLYKKLTSDMLVTSSEVVDFYKKLTANTDSDVLNVVTSKSKSKNWGGARRGAGRKKKPDSERRKARSLCATDREWLNFKKIMVDYRKQVNAGKTSFSITINL